MITSTGGSRVHGLKGAGCHGGRSRSGAADWWFHALDQQTAAVGGEWWTLHVMGIHADRGQLWIQLQPSPESFPGLVLRVSSATRLDAAMEALRTTKWGSERPHIVDAIRPDRRRSKTRASA